jgi:hypothetical protein
MPPDNISKISLTRLTPYGVTSIPLHATRIRGLGIGGDVSDARDRLSEQTKFQRFVSLPRAQSDLARALAQDVLSSGLTGAQGARVRRTARA